jgi:putative tryptophan/tyrosine transport system substrate-binding protein
LTSALEPKRLGLLRELVPPAATLTVPLNVDNPPAEQQLRDVQEAARAINLPVQVLRAGTDHEIDAAFEVMAQQRKTAF